MAIVYHGDLDAVDVPVDGVLHRVTRLEPVDFPDAVEANLLQSPENWKPATKKQAENAKEID
jgi:hypothetical protein